MKLHLPKMLLIAVLAAVAMAPAAWAGWGDLESQWAGNYWVNDANNIDATGTDSGNPDSFTVQSGNINTAEVAEFIMRNGQSMTVAANSGATGGANLALTINSLTINPAEGAEGNGSASITVNADQSLTVDAITGSLSTVTAKGSFTYGGGGTISTVNLGESKTDTSSVINVTAATTLTNVNAWCGTLYVDAGSDALVTIGTYDGGKGENGVGKARGGAYVKAGSRLQINTMYYHKDNTSNAVTLEAGAVLTLGAGGLTVTGTSSEAGSLATVDRHYAGGQYSYTETNYTISNGQVKLNNGTLGNVLTNVSILHDGAGTLTLTNTSDTLKDITASAGTVAINAGLKLGGQITTSGNGEVVIKGAVVNTGMSFAENSALTVKDWTAFAGNGEYYGGAISGNGVFRGNYTVLEASSTTKADVKISYDGNVYTTDANGAVAIHDTSLFFVNAETESVSTVTNLAATKIRMSDNTGLVIDGSIDSVSAASGANLTWTLNTTDATTPVIGAINAGGASISVSKDAASASSELSLGDTAHAVGSLTIGDGVTVTSSWSGGDNGVGFIDGAVKVSAGGILTLTATTDAFGYTKSNISANATDSVTLEGESSQKLATLKLSGRATLEVTDVILKGNTLVTYTSDDDKGADERNVNKASFDTYGKGFTISGKNNVSDVGIRLRKNTEINVAAEGEFTQTGKVYIGNNQSATLTKSGAGTITFENSVEAKNYTSSGGNSIFDGESDITGSLTASAGEVSFNKASEIASASVSGTGKINFNAGSVITGTLTASAGEINYGKGSHSVTTLDASSNGTSTATITIKKDGEVTADTIWAGPDSTIKMEEGGTLKADGGVVSIKGTNATAGTTLKASTNGAYVLGGTKTVNTVACDSANFTISNAEVNVDTTSGNKTIGNRLDNVALTNKNSNTGAITERTLTADNGYNNYSAVIAAEGDVNITNFNKEGLQGTLQNLTIGTVRTVGIYSGDAVPEAPTTENEATVTVSALTITGVDATLNANLVLTNDAVVDMYGALNMGSSLTLGNNMTLDGQRYDHVEDLTAGGWSILFAGVDSLILDGVSYSEVAEGKVQMNHYFTNVTNDEIYLALDTDGYVYAGIALPVPEPTTATLSLLALAGLAARRRRK